MKNKQQKEISIIVKEIKDMLSFHNAVAIFSIPEHDYEACAEQILIELKSNEIELAKRKGNRFN